MVEMESKEAIVINPETQEMRLGALVTTPSNVIHQATIIAKELAKIINDQKLYTNINGKKFVRVEGWTTLGAMLGVLPVEDIVIEKEDGSFEATVNLIRTTDGAIIGRGSAIVGPDEKTWKTRPRYARRSMAITRATGKAFRLGFSWIMTLAGYEATPAEKVVDIIEGQFEKSSPAMSLETVQNVTNSKGIRYGDMTKDELQHMALGIKKAIEKNNISSEQHEEYLFKLDAIRTILAAAHEK